MSKHAITLAAITFSIVILMLVFQLGYSKGYSNKSDEYQKAYDKAVLEQRKIFAKKIAEAEALLISETKAEIERVKQNQKVKIKEVEVIKYVEREIKIPTNCTNLARNINRVLHDAASNVTEATGPDTEDTKIFTNSVSEFQF